MAGNYPRRAVVTGADSGIGRATAELLATEGFDVGITYHSDSEGAAGTARAVEQRGQRSAVVQQDLASPEAGHAVDELAAALGGLSVLVNCGGTGVASRAVDLSYEKWRQVVATDLDGAFLCRRS